MAEKQKFSRQAASEQIKDIILTASKNTPQ